MEIGFIGLGKLGMPCAEVMATKHNVSGFDVNIVSGENIEIVQNIEQTVIGKDFTFIAVPTPHHKDYDGRKPTSFLKPKDFDYSYVIDVLKQLSEIEHDSTIVLISTVLPGTVRREFSKYLDKSKFIYNPYLIAMGTVKDDMINPEMIIIGHDNNRDDVDRLIEFYHTICNCKRFAIGSWEEAESIKIFYNTFISMKLAFANMVLDVAEELENIEPDFVLNVLSGSKKRIMSDMYMKSGMGDGGPCHPRDNIALSALSERLELGYDLFSSVMEIRERQAENLARKLCSYDRQVVILGKSYKPSVKLIDGSYSILVGNYVEMYDFKCTYDKNPETDEPVTYLLAHRHKYYDFNFIPGSIIVDPWGECPEIGGCKVVYYGRK